MKLEPARCLCVRTGTGLTVVRSTPAGIAEVAGTAFVTLRPLRVVLTTLKEKAEQSEKEKEENFIGLKKKKRKF